MFLSKAITPMLSLFLLVDKDEAEDFYILPFLAYTQTNRTESSVLPETDYSGKALILGWGKWFVMFGFHKAYSEEASI